MTKKIKAFPLLLMALTLTTGIGFSTKISDETRISGSLFYTLDPSVYTYGYGPHFKQAASLWNGITPSVLLKPASNKAPTDIYYVSNSRIQGLLGTQLGYSKDILGRYKPSTEINKWQFSTVMLYDNNMDALSLSYQERISTTAHEIGHSLGLSHPLTTEPSLMRQGVQSIGPMPFDRFELKRKWGIAHLPSSLAFKNDNREIISVSANYESYEKVDLADASADLIVLGKPLSPFESRKHTVRYNDQGLITDFYTTTPIQMVDIYKNRASSSVKVGGQLEVLEPIALLSDENASTLFQYENYTEMNEGSVYIIFLKKNTFGQYSVMNMSLGRIDTGSTQRFSITADQPIEEKAALPKTEMPLDPANGFIQEALSKYLK